MPAAVDFKKPWELADEMLRHVGPRLPHRWIVGDTEFGRSTAFRDRLAKRGERYRVGGSRRTMVVRKGGAAEGGPAADVAPGLLLPPTARHPGVEAIHGS